MMEINKIKYNSIAEAKARKEDIKAEVLKLIEESQALQRGINTMDGCNYQNSCTNQPNQY